MNKIKLAMIFLVAVAYLVVLVVHAQPNKPAQPKEVKQKAAAVQSKDKVEPKQIKPQTRPAVSEVKAAPVSIPERSPFEGSRQGYKMVTDVLDGFGGESESDNYRIPVNSGGQPSAIGISESGNYVVEAGYVHASFIMRGDANADRLINIADVVYVVNYLFTSGLDPCPMEAGDATCDGSVNIADAVYLVNYLFIGGDPPGC